MAKLFACKDYVDDFRVDRLFTNPESWCLPYLERDFALTWEHLWICRSGDANEVPSQLL